MLYPVVLMYTDGKLMPGTEQICCNDVALSAGFLTFSFLSENQAQIWLWYFSAALEVYRVLIISL